jgi:hypothetical protein
MIEFLLVAVLIVLVWLIVPIRARNEPFLSELVSRYPFDTLGQSDPRIDYVRKYFGWRDTGRRTSRFSGMSKLGTSDDMLVLKHPLLFRSLIPSIAVPKQRLRYVGTEFLWSAVRKFDVFEVDGLPSGQLLLPVNFVARDNLEEF